jgi:methylamine dehydrogenase light chain
MIKFIKALNSNLEKVMETSARSTDRRNGRRSALARMGGILVGGAATTTLPFNRAFGETPPKGDVNDDTSCDYWRYCALDGLLWATAGGTKKSCPVGAEASEVAWVGTCQNPNDEKDYLISYYDCCGKSAYLGAQFCLQSKGERPAYRMGLHNDINWCMANANKGYHCTVAIVLGEA